MEFKGRYLIPASAETVWAALNDPDILRHCIPGCEQMEKNDPTHFSAVSTLKIGPVKATFKANMVLADLDPPRRCTLKGEGQGGVAGFARGEAEVLLEPEADGTILSYMAEATIGGKLAQIGQRLIDGAAKQIADDFFTRFAATVSAAKVLAASSIPAAASPEAELAAPVPAAATPTNRRPGLAPEVWVVGVIAAIAILLLLFGVVLDR
ncbi:MAG: CoxG family protein [Rhizomicrobium sp.]